jgi:Cu/Ag efflux protein CusF
LKAAIAIVALGVTIGLSGVAFPALARSGPPSVAAPQTAEGMGVVKSMNPTAGTVVLQHDPIAALKWPAMTMAFKVESAAVLSGVAVGKRVHFMLKNVDGKPVVTQIHVLD